MCHRFNGATKIVVGSTPRLFIKHKEKMSRKNVRVIIPRNADELIELCESIVAKHNEDPATSPLVGLDMAAFEALVTDGRTANENVKQLRRNAETATEQRDTLLGHRRDQSTNTPNTLLNYVVRSREILLGSFKGTEQRLGDFGFEVNQSSAGSGGSSSGGTDDDAEPDLANLTGTITDAVSMLPIPGAVVRIMDEDVVLVADSSGRIATDEVPYGTYSMEVSASGYLTTLEPLFVNAPDVEFSVALTPQGT